MELEEAEARARAAVEAAAGAAGEGGTATPVEEVPRDRCKEGVLLKFKGRYQTTLSLKVRASGPGGLEVIAAGIEAAWQQAGWTVGRQQRAGSPTGDLSADDDGFLLAARFFDDPSGGFLRVTAVTPCAKPRGSHDDS